MGKVLVVGGGFAGLSAATALAEAGHRVELLESRNALGGRVYSIPSTESFPAPCDNGPHLLMGCYHETLRLFDRIGAAEPFRWIDPLKLSWLLPGGQKVSLNCAPLPAPFHLAFGLLTSNAFPWAEKIRLAKALSAFSQQPFHLASGIITVDQFLKVTGQGPAARERFWLPICNAVMNVGPEEALIAGLGQVLHRVFFGNRRDSALAVTTRPLSELGFPQGIAYLKERDCSVLFGEGIQSFQTDEKHFQLTSRTGKKFTGEALIWAVPPSSLLALWPQGTWPALQEVPRLGKSPIVSVNLILSLPVIDQDLVGLSGAQFEWVFNRASNWGWKGEGQYLSLVASAAEKLARGTEKELVDLAFGELKDRCIKAREATVLHAKVIREMAATFRWSPGSDALRLPCETPYPKVFLAGDWTATGLPATIEGACLSGHQAAEKTQAALEKIE